MRQAIRFFALLVPALLFGQGDHTVTGKLTVGGTMDASTSVSSRPNKTGPLANRPTNCTAGDTYIATDGTGGQVLYAAKATGTPCTTWTLVGDGVGAGGGTINSTGFGFDKPFTMAGYEANTSGIVNNPIYRGLIVQRTYASQEERRWVSLRIGGTGEAGKAIKVCVYSSDKATKVADFEYFPTDNINTSLTRNAIGGSQVIGGVWTRLAGSYWWYIFSDSITAQINGEAGSQSHMWATTFSNNIAYRTGVAAGSGTGSGLTCPNDLLGTTGGSPVAWNTTPMVLSGN